MYNLLIVDDEPVILKSLCQTILELREDKFVVYSASSAISALEIFQNTRIDLLLADIRMPGIDGLQLMRLVEEQWPGCRTIFLTGHSEFDYARQAVRPSIIAYILKSEGDEALLAALDEGYERLDREYEEQSHRLALDTSLELALPLIRCECLRQMISEENWDEEKKAKLHENLRTADVVIHTDRPFILVLVQMEPGWNAITQRKIQNAIEEVLKHHYSMISASVTKHVLLLAVQSAPENLSPIKVKNLLEIALNLCSHALVPQPQILVYDSTLMLEKLPSAYGTLYHMRLELNGVAGVRCCDPGECNSSFTWRSKISIMGAFRIEGFSECLATGNRDEYFKLLEQLLQEIKAPSLPTATTIFATLSSLLLQAIHNQLPKESNFFSRIPLEYLVNYHMHSGFSAAIQFLDDVAEEYFKIRNEVNSTTRSHIIHRITEYVMKNIAGDLSLTRLSELVGLHPSYLSKLYRDATGISINQYVVNQRLRAAQDLLADPFLKIHEIVAMTGLNTPSYFTHYFKKHIGITPQEYRTSILK